MYTRFGFFLRVGAVACSVLVVSARAWDGCGHQVVAEIGYAQLPPATRAAVDGIFSADPRGRQFVNAATWPDDIKSGKRNSPPSAPTDSAWHFINLSYDATPQQEAKTLINGGAKVVVGNPKSANVVTAIAYYRNFLAGGTGAPIDKADALSWLIHLVGDVHQPLHCVNVYDPLPNYTPPANGDEGGNGFLITHPANELHALWDDSFDEPTGGPNGQGRDSSEQHAADVAANLRSTIHSDPAAVANQNPAEWAKESYSYRTQAYDLPLTASASGASATHAVSADYLTWEEGVASHRVVLAGDRLAVLLTKLFPPSAAK